MCNRMQVMAGAALSAVLAVLMALLPLNSGAQTWSSTNINDTTVRPDSLSWVVDYVDATTTTLNDGSADFLVAAFSISSSATDSVPAGDIANSTLSIPRKLAVQFKENSGSALVGSITIYGTNQFGLPTQDKITTAGGVRYAVTTNAYAHVDAIVIDLTGNAASDVLNIGFYGVGVRARTAALLGQTKLASATPTTLAGTWSSTRSTYVSNSALAAGNHLNLSWHSELTTDASTNRITVAATLLTFAGI